MSIKAYVTTSNLNVVSSIKVEDTEILTTLGTEEEAVAMQLQDLFESVMKAIKPSIESESQLNRNYRFD